jgi:hypothetical protein
VVVLVVVVVVVLLLLLGSHPHPIRDLVHFQEAPRPLALSSPARMDL